MTTLWADCESGAGCLPHLSGLRITTPAAFRHVAAVSLRIFGGFFDQSQRPCIRPSEVDPEARACYVDQHIYDCHQSGVYTLDPDAASEVHSVADLHRNKLQFHKPSSV